MDKIYYPQKRVLEDYDTNTQKKYGYDPTLNETYELIESKVAKVVVQIEDQLGNISKDSRWISTYKITLGSNEPFVAGIITNYETSTNGAAYRIITDSNGIVDFTYD